MRVVVDVARMGDFLSPHGHTTTRGTVCQVYFFAADSAVYRRGGSPRPPCLSAAVPLLYAVRGLLDVSALWQVGGRLWHIRAPDRPETGIVASPHPHLKFSLHLLAFPIPL